MRSLRRLLPCVALAAASCTSSTAPDVAVSSATTSRETVATDPVPERVEADQPDQHSLPEGYELAVTGTVVRAVPAGSMAVRTIAAVGSSPSDPRVLEYTLFALGDDVDLDAVTEMVGAFEPTAIIELDGGQFAFVTETADRPQLDLLSRGPTVNASFRALVDDRVVAIGGSANLQPQIIEEMLATLSADQSPGSDGLPQTMSVLVDGVLPDGRFVELSSVHGTTTVVVYDDVGREWFDYFTWGDPDIPLPDAMAELADAVSLQPVTNFGIGGIAEDPVRFSFWSDGRLTIIEQPESVSADDATAVAALMLDRVGFDTLVAGATALEPAAPTDDSADAAQPASRAPTEVEMAAFQQFVETKIGVEYDRPISFNYVADFPTDGVSFQFISTELWLVASALGLTEEGQTHDGANQARLDAVRGTPGTIALQPTQTETNVVTVHEMVHVVDFEAADAPSAEPFSMLQVVLEGNAHRVAWDYLQTLDETEQATMEPFPHIFPDEGDPRISQAVQDLLEFPYDEGRLFMAAAAADGGRPGVAEVFERPPVSTEQILFFDAWARDDQPTGVPVPKPPEESTTVGGGSLGVYLLLLVATETGSGNAALEPLSEWSGDSFILYETGADLCLEATMVFDSAAAAAALGEILEKSATTIGIDADTIQATFCS